MVSPYLEDPAKGALAEVPDEDDVVPVVLQRVQLRVQQRSRLVVGVVVGHETSAGRCYPGLHVGGRVYSTVALYTTQCVIQ